MRAREQLDAALGGKAAGPAKRTGLCRPKTKAQLAPQLDDESVRVLSQRVAQPGGAHGHVPEQVPDLRPSEGGQGSRKPGFTVLHRTLVGQPRVRPERAPDVDERGLDLRAHPRFGRATPTFDCPQALRFSLWRSASTIIWTSSSKLTLGCQPSLARVFVQSASSRSTSAGRSRPGSITTCFCQSRPTCPKAISANSRTLCDCPLPMT